MNDQITKVLNHLEKLDAEERTRNDVPQEDRMFTLHPDTAQLVHMLIESTQSKNIVEGGVAHGYSTIWLARAAKLTGGRVKSLEINPKNVERAQINVQNAGLINYVDFIEGDGLKTLLDIKDTIDFALIDCWEWLYIDLLSIIRKKLRPGGFLIADNVTPGTETSDKFINTLKKDPLFNTVSVPIGRNIQFSAKIS